MRGSESLKHGNKMIIVSVLFITLSGFIGVLDNMGILPDNINIATLFGGDSMFWEIISAIGVILGVFSAVAIALIQHRSYQKVIKEKIDNHQVKSSEEHNNLTEKLSNINMGLAEKVEKVYANVSAKAKVDDERHNALNKDQKFLTDVVKSFVAEMSRVNLENKKLTEENDRLKIEKEYLEKSLKREKEIRRDLQSKHTATEKRAEDDLDLEY